MHNAGSRRIAQFSGGVVLALLAQACLATMAAEIFGPSPTTVETPGTGSAISLQDLDGDGAADLIVGTRDATGSGGHLAVWLSDGLGGLDPRGSVPVEGTPVALAVADFDGDGIADIAVAREAAARAAGGVTIFPGVRQRLFGSRRIEVLPGVSAGAMATDDFDLDGRTDLAIGVAVGDRGFVRILLNDGGATFRTVGSREVGRDVRSMAAGDLDGDGVPDIAVVGGGALHRLFGDGRGGVRRADVRTEPAGRTLSVHSSDINRDGAADLVVSVGVFVACDSPDDGNCDDVDENERFIDLRTRLVLANGNGGFYDRPGSFGDVGSIACLGDFDGDGNLDALIGPSIFSGDGHGRFVPNGSSLPFSSSLAVAADVNRDANADVAAILTPAVRRDGPGNVTSGSPAAGPMARISVYLSDSHGGFIAPTSLSLGAQSLIVGDFVREDPAASDAADLLMIDNYANLSLLAGDGRGGFALHSTLGRSAHDASAGDLDGDGDDDIVEAVGVSNGLYLRALRNDQEGRFVEVWAFHRTDRSGTFKLGDFDGDGVLDVGVRWSEQGATKSIEFLRGDGSGGFNSGGEVLVDGNLTDLAQFVKVRVDSSGRDALAIVLPEIGEINATVFQFTAADAPVRTLRFRIPSATGVLAVGDLEDDGIDEWIVSRQDETAAIWRRATAGTPESMTPLRAVSTTVSAAFVADLNGDERRDLILRGTQGSVHVLLRDSMEEFRRVQIVQSGGGIVADLNGDGDPDLLSDSTVLLNRRRVRQDTNGSNRIDGFDVAILGRAAGTHEGEPEYRRAADVNLDGIVDGTDLADLAGSSRFGSLVEIPSPLRAISTPGTDPVAVAGVGVSLEPAGSDGGKLLVRLVVHGPLTAVRGADVAFEIDATGSVVLSEVRPGTLFGDLDVAYRLTPTGRLSVVPIQNASVSVLGDAVLATIVLAPTKVGEASVRFDGSSVLLDQGGNPIGGLDFTGETRIAVSAVGASDRAGQAVVAPEVVEFGTISRGGSARRSIRIRNSGLGDLSVTAVTLDPPNGPFRTYFPSGGDVTIPPLGFIDVDTVFQPSGAGRFAATIVIASDDPARPEARLPVRGDVAAAIGVWPQSIDFGDLAIGGSLTRTLRVTNGGTAPLVLTGLESTTSQLPVLSSFGTLAPEERGELTVRFLPLHDGVERGRLSLRFQGAEPIKIEVPVAGRGFADGDGDGREDALDRCPYVFQLAASDVDSDSLDDACDPCPSDPRNDEDGDGVCVGYRFHAPKTGENDDCPSVANPDQADTDRDGVGDACDHCSGADSDRDGVCNTADNCPNVGNPDQADADTDGRGDTCDSCPQVSDEPNGDLDADCVDGSGDNCPSVQNTDQEDRDADGIGDECDNCPLAANPVQANGDEDALGDLCDACPEDTVNDEDFDGSCGSRDNCPTVPNGLQADADGDGIGDVCDGCLNPTQSIPSDRDGDGIDDACDLCPDDFGGGDPPDDDGVCWSIDNCPYAANPYQVDADGDGLGDACDPCPTDTGNPDRDGDGLCDDVDPCPDDVDNDQDGDGVCAAQDNCREAANPDQRDTDGDGRGDACDPCPRAAEPDVWIDSDYDSIPNHCDDCPDVRDPEQRDSDSDGVGDACDVCPDSADPSQPDRDDDGVGDACDPDPDVAYRVRSDLPGNFWLGDPITTTFRLEDVTGHPIIDRQGVRVALRLTGPAHFGMRASRGVLINGGGTDVALVQFVDGVVTLELAGTAEGRLILSGDDVDRVGIEVSTDLFADFEADGGGFAGYGWQWGAPRVGGVIASSGTNVWGTRLEEALPCSTFGTLEGPSIAFVGARPKLTFRSWRDLPPGASAGVSACTIAYGDCYSAEVAGSPTTSGAWTEFATSLPAKRTVPGQLSFYFNLNTIPERPCPTEAGWFIDDVSVSGVVPVVNVLDPSGDWDQDGVLNPDEVAQGTDPSSGDTDRDGISDGSDNCATLPNANQLNFVHPGGKGDACEDPDGDGVPDAGDDCPDASDALQHDTDGDGFGDACNDATDRDGDEIADTYDLCPDLALPELQDRDGDGVGDACDPLPDLSLRVLVSVPEAASPAGGSARVTFRLVDAAGTPWTESGTLQVVLTASSSAVFASAAVRGSVVEGARTARIVALFHEGILEIDVTDNRAESVRFVAQGPPGSGVAIAGERRFTFERDDGGFDASRPIDVFSWSPDGLPSRLRGRIALGEHVPTQVLPVDLDGDGTLDLLQLETGSVSWLRGDRTTGFGVPRILLSDHSIAAFAAVDVTHDGRLDVIAALGWDYSPPTFVVLGNAGAGAFRELWRETDGSYPQLSVGGLASGDVDGDGDADLLAGSPLGRLRILFGDGTGQFVLGGGSNVPSSPETTRPLTEDFNGDGLADFATSDNSATWIGVFLADGSGSFYRAPGGSYLGPVFALAHFDDNEVVDLVTVSPWSDKVVVYLGDGSGGFTPSIEVVADGNSSAIAVGDVDGDGDVDVVSASEDRRSLRWYLGDGAGGLRVGATHYVLAEPTSLSAGDVDGDGRSEIFVTDGAPAVWERGVPHSGPGQAAQGLNVWATRLDGDYPNGVDAELRSPPISVEPGALPLLTYSSWFSGDPCCDAGTVEVSDDSGGTWTSVDDLRGDLGGWVSRDVDLSRWAGQEIRVRFKLRTDAHATGPGWYVDDVVFHGLDPVVRFVDPRSDVDGDGSTLLEEQQAGTDPSDPDSDDDGILDGADDCPSVYDPDQADAIRRGHGGDACDDADGDGVRDLRDVCPLIADPEQVDADGDGVGDACDPWPLTTIVVRPIPTRTWSLLGQPVTVDYVLEDPTGATLTGIGGVIATLTVDGGAHFSDSAVAGEILAGRGTSRVRVRFEGGHAAVGVVLDRAATVHLGGVDADRIGIFFVADRRFTLGSNDGGARTSGESGVWRWGEPREGPSPPDGASRVWSGTIDGPDTNGSRQADLLSARLLLPAREHPVLDVVDWFDDREHTNTLKIEVRPFGSYPRDVPLDGSERSDYARRAYDLTPLSGSISDVRFAMHAPHSSAISHWNVAEFQIAGLTRLIEFLDPQGDRDGDGISNRHEADEGFDPIDPDQDVDTVRDGEDNCRGVWNRDQSDRVHPNGVGDGCDDPDGDGVVDSRDNCPDVVNHDQSDRDGDGQGDSCGSADDPDGDLWSNSRDNCPEMANPDQSDSDGDGLGDACDPYPDLKLVVRPSAPRLATTGGPVRLTLRLEDDRGHLLSDLEHIRIRTSVSGSATLGDHATRGILVSGGSGSDATLEFVNGFAEIELTDAAEELVSVTGHDEERVGVVLDAGFFADFEGSDDGFETLPVTSDFCSGPGPFGTWWRRGVPDTGPLAAASGSEAWGTRLIGSADAYCARGAMVSPWFALRPGSAAQLDLERWSAGISATIQLETRDGAIVLLQLPTGGTVWTHDTVDLAGVVTSEARLGFWFDAYTLGTDRGLFLDAIALRGASRSIRFLSPAGDSDSDGVSNEGEIVAGTDPLSADSDHDGKPDGEDNCPLVANYDQLDRVHPGGAGDVCDDPDGDQIPDSRDDCPDAFDPGQQDSDGDHVPDACNDALDADGDEWADALDNCPSVANGDQSDRDRDGVGDACDPFPDQALFVSPRPLGATIQGTPVDVVFSIQDQDGRPVPEADGIEMTVTLSGSAVITEAVGRGRVLDGLGTGRVRVAFESGQLDLTIEDPIAETITVSGEDPDRVGIAVDRPIFQDFESDEGGFSSSGSFGDAWSRGSLSPLQGGAHSGTYGWSVNLQAVDHPMYGCYGTLLSPFYAIEPGRTVHVGFWRWLSAQPWRFSAEYWTDLTGDWSSMGPVSLAETGQWAESAFEIPVPNGNSLQFRIIFGGYCLAPSDTLNLDDVVVRGMPTRITFELAAEVSGSAFGDGCDSTP